MPPVTQRRQQKRPADFTGIQKQRMEADHAEELKIKAKEMTMATEAAAIEKTELVDYTKSSMEAAVVSDEIELKEPQVTIRVLDKIEQMVYGREITPQGEVGPLKMYDFEPGTPYRVPREVADHLESLGYLYAGR